MQKQNSNQIHIQKQNQSARLIHYPEENPSDRLNGIYQTKSFRDNMMPFNTPYFESSNSNSFIETSTHQNGLTSAFHTFSIKDNDKNNRSILSENDTIELRNNFVSKPIENKYGLGVRRLEKTPRNSNTHGDSKHDSQKIHQTYQSVYEDYQPTEKKSFDSVNVFVDNRRTNQIIEKPAEKPAKNVQMNSMPVVPPSHLILTKNSIKEEKEIYVQSVPDTKAESIKAIEKVLAPSVKRIAEEIIQLKIENVGTYEGTIRNNMLNGFGKLWDYQNRLVYEGEFFDNNFEGIGIQYNYFDQLSQIANLTTEIRLPNNWVKFEGLFHENKKTGMSSLTFYDGSFFYGEFENDQANGFGSHINKLGEVKRGIWKNNVLVQS